MASKDDILMIMVLLLLTVASMASLTPSQLFGSNMVLQASPKHSSFVFGSAQSGAEIVLTDSSRWHPRQQYNTTADASGRWEIALEPYEVAAGDPNNFTLTLSSGNSRSVASNVAYGTVILCSGQSNMGLNLIPIYNSTAIIEAAHHPEIRLFHVPTAFSPVPLHSLPNGTSWIPTEPSTIPQFSAVCYLTTLELERMRTEADGEKRDIMRDRRLPGARVAAPKRAYGLVLAAQGSTDVQSWMSASMRHTALSSCWDDRTATNLPPSNSHAPAGGTGASELWNAMVAPLVPLAASALLWDQGENNAHYCSRAQYACLFRSMVQGWRTAFRRADPASLLPVAAVQLGGYAGGDNVSTIRFAQSDSLPAAAAAAISNVSGRAVAAAALAPTYDLGSPQPGSTDPHAHWIHCRNKTEVGRRLAGALYPLLNNSPSVVTLGSGGKKGTRTRAGLGTDVPIGGPIVESAALEMDAVTRQPRARLRLTRANGLALLPAQGCFAYCCRQSPAADTATGPSRPSGTQRLTMPWAVFEVANRKGDWLPAMGAIDASGELIVTPHSNVTGNWLSQVRYAALDIPECALYNTKNMLPALPFELPVPWRTSS